MSEPESSNASSPKESSTPSQEFALFCEAEFERRLNSGSDFDEQRYRRAMGLVVEKLQRLEDEGRV
jgi:hypothetical protein